jgi:hypothetical protein
MAQDTTQAELQQILAKLDGIERADAPWASSSSEGETALSLANALNLDDDDE